MATHPLSPLLHPHVDSVRRAIPHLLGQSFATLLFCHHISPDSGSPSAVHMSVSPRTTLEGSPKHQSLWMAVSRCFVPGHTENTDQYFSKPHPYSLFSHINIIFHIYPSQY
ncbi:hypothetical protein ILYODFUR_037096 [Ilyodon furcidens]|uniref:Uncharacterized protein n=1 Tax=Ilyodon furcidens TaxID=33524 RepID=A0ABV0U1J5_9TELE